MGRREEILDFECMHQETHAWRATSHPPPEQQLSGTPRMNQAVAIQALDDERLLMDVGCT